MTTTWRYSVSVGLSGCYMPNTTSGPLTGTTRRELANLIRDELRMLDVPEYRMREIKLNRLWAFIKHHGSSTAHFSIAIGNGEEIAFNGLTEDEANNWEND